MNCDEVETKDNGRHCYVAVVTRVSGQYRSERPHSDYAAIGPSRDNVIRRALAAHKEWSRHDGDIYQILVGELTGKVEQPVRYEVVPL